MAFVVRRERPARTAGRGAIGAIARSSRATLVALLALGPWAACEGSDAHDPSDAGGDGSISGRVAPEGPRFTPCPSGWREIPGEGFASCAPEAPAPCPAGTGTFPSSGGCVTLGHECPADGWPVDLPTGRAVIWVDDDASPGGDGRSQASAFTSIREAVLAAPAEAVVAVATGTYAESDVALTGISLVGACARETVLLATRTSSTPFLVLTGRAEVADVALDAGDRIALGTMGTGAAIHALEIRSWGSIGLYVVGGSALADRVSVARSDGAPGRWGIAVARGGTLTVEGAYIRGATQEALFATDAGSVLDATDVVVAGVTLDPDVGEARGGYAAAGASLVLRGVVLSDVEGMAVLVTDPGSEAALIDVVVRGARADVGGRAEGIVVIDGGAARLERVSITGAIGAAVWVHRGSLDAHDLLVSGVRPIESSLEAGYGVLIDDGSDATLERVHLADTMSAGLRVTGEGSTTDARDLEIRRVAPQASNGLGAGAVVELGASATFARISVRTAPAFGIVAAAAGSIRATDVLVADVPTATCHGPACSVGSVGGFALAAGPGGSLAASAFVVEGASLCGALVTIGGAMDLSSGTVGRVPVGACVQDPTFDVNRLHQGVSFIDVEVPLMSTSYALPGDAFGSL